MFYPIIISTFAGLSTAVGALIVISGKNITTEKMAQAQGFAAGVMLTVSFFDLIPESYGKYFVYMNAFYAFRAVASLFACGWVAGMAISSFAVPAMHCEDMSKASARRMALLTTLVMIIHNLPEGMLTVFSTTENISSGIRLALAVALHNLPEGMAIASPVLYVTASRKKAFMQAFMAGMAEPVGGILAYCVLHSIINIHFINGLMPVIAGIMCQTAICELIPDSVRLSNIKHTLYGIITGIVVMSIGLFVF